MITHWTVGNFKSIREETHLMLGPLTIFAGANNSGKSSFIQSILLVAQTLAHKGSSPPIVLNGNITNLGQFDDLKSNGSEVDHISIKWTCRPSNQNNSLSSQNGASSPSIMVNENATDYGPSANHIYEIACEISFDADPSSPQRDQLQVQPRLLATLLSCVHGDENIDFDDPDKDIFRADISINHLSKYSAETNDDEMIEFLKNPPTILSYNVELDEFSMLDVMEDHHSAEPIGCLLRHFLPEEILYIINSIEERAKYITGALQYREYRSNLHRSHGNIILSKEVITVLREILKGNSNLDKESENKLWRGASGSANITLRGLYNRLASLTPKQQSEIRQAIGEQQNLYDRIYAAMKESAGKDSEKLEYFHDKPPQLLNRSAWYLDDFFTSSLKYLGPLRDAPKLLYPLAPSLSPYDVGIRGEHTASILALHKGKMIQYMPSANFTDTVVERIPITQTLEEAVVDWLRYFGLADSVQSRKRENYGYELKVGLDHSHIMHDLVHVGVGVSQVLPILVMCLLADSDATLIFEQPELHLHPRVQTLLGDFFLSMALCGKQCIVETHSEYLIDRLRFRIAAAPPGQELNNQTKMYFVEKSSESSTFREVRINEYGAISEWPKGFFDQSQEQSEKILMAATKKRKANRNRQEKTQ